MKKKSSGRQFEPVPVKEIVTTKVQVIHPETLTAFYSNYVEVAHSEYEFSLSFSKLPSKLRPQQLLDVQAGQPLVLEPQLLIDIPTRLVKGLIRALEAQVSRYETRYGELPDPKAQQGDGNGKRTEKT